VGAPAPQGVEKIFVGVIYRQKFVSAPQHTKCTHRQSNLGHVLLGGGDLVYLVVLDRLTVC